MQPGGPSTLGLVPLPLKRRQNGFVWPRGTTGRLHFVPRGRPALRLRLPTDYVVVLLII